MFDLLCRSDKKFFQAIRLYNNASNPAALRTEHQHSLYDKVARKVRRFLDAYYEGCFHETENGKLIPD